MSKGRLTRQELGWLLTQEAQGAAERLRLGVQVLCTNIPPAPTEADADPSRHVESSLDALDDVMKMLSNLHTKPAAGSSGAAARRGRVDLASLLWDVAPEARVSIEPGSGTEVFGEEAELRRMLHVLVGHGAGVGSAVTIRRDGDDVRVAVVLGPDSSATAETERIWLSRMALRYGGRHELEGASEVLTLPADGVSERKEREALRKELDEARQQGEAYARELAAIFAHGEEIQTASSYPPPPLAQPVERFATLARLTGGVAAELRGLLTPIGRDLQALRTSQENVEEQLESLRTRFLQVQDFVVGLTSIGELDPEEAAADIDLIELTRNVVAQLSARASRTAVTLRCAPEGNLRRYVRSAQRATGVLVRELVAQAIAASPRGSEVAVIVSAPGEGSSPNLGTRLLIDDGGSPLPASARRQFLSLEVDPRTYGRPSSIPLHVCGEIATRNGAMLELSDAPAPLGGLRVAVTFPVSFR